MQDRHGTLLGELLVIVGHLTRDELINILHVKTEEAIYELFLWQEGDFRFLENILPAKKFQPLNLPVDARADSPAEVAAIIRARRGLGLASGLLVTNETDLAERLDAIAFPGLTANFDAASSAL